MKPCRVYLILLLIFLECISVASGQVKKEKQVPLQSQNKIEAPANLPPQRQESKDSLVYAAKQQLTDDYYASERCKRENTGMAGQQQILNVAWLDADFNKVSAVIRGEMISIAVLTRGYSIGDTIRVTIGDKEDGTMIPGVDCSEITFTGILNYEDFALLQHIFSIEGEEEEMVIDPAWKDRYSCK